MYASVCDFGCIALLLPFVLGFCLSVFWGVFLVQFLVLGIIGGFVFWLGSSLILFFFLITF